MTHDAHQKVKASHLKRNAYLYVRQSTLRQVLENTESTQRQYALKQHAVSLGWPLDRIVVIDTDLGQSGASAADREGFKRLVTEVSPGHAGIVLGLEVSRLARNSMDWHRLLEICALSDTLILDEDGVYDPAHFNDRLLLGLKGTMTVRYHSRRGQLVPDYMCQREGIERGEPVCQHVPGAAIDDKVGELLVEALTPVTIDVALAVQGELQTRLEEADRLRQQQVERARYEAELARRRYLRVDPDHRLVADSLEADWNAKLKLVAEAQESCDRQRSEDRRLIDERQRAAILALSTTFPQLWRDPATPDRERKRMVRLLLEDVTLVREDHHLAVHIRFKGGAQRSVQLPLPQRSWEQRQTNPEVVATIDRLLDHHPYPEIAAKLNEEGLHSGEGLPFTARIVARIQRSYGLATRYDRLRQAGMLTVEEIAKVLGVHPQSITKWNRAGLLRGHAFNGKNDCLYEPPGDNAPRKAMGVKLSERAAARALTLQGTEEVQCEA